MDSRKNEIDIHGLSISEAEVELDYFIDYLDDKVDEITVIHGYKTGQALLNFVRKTYKHERVQQKLVSMNQGITIFLLKKSW